MSYAILLRLLLGTTVTALLVTPLYVSAQLDITNVNYNYGEQFSQGSYNSSFGYFALDSISNDADYNTAVGAFALRYNTADSNTAIGSAALALSTTGFYNTAVGANALYKTTTGDNNTAHGYNTLRNNTTGNFNTALGYQAGYNITTGGNNIAIGNSGSATDSGTIRIGTTSSQTKAFIAGISGVTASGGVQVFINSSGQLGTLTSSGRFKNDIKDMGTVSEKLMKLRPVTFHYKDAAEDGTHPLQYGLIAEEVAKVDPDLVQYDKDGKPFTVYYHLLTPMLLSELQKEHQQNQVQKQEIAQQEREISKQKTEIATLKTALQQQKLALQQQGTQLASLKQAQQQQLQVLSKLAVLAQTNQKGQTRKAVYRP